MYDYTLEGVGSFSTSCRDWDGTTPQAYAETVVRKYNETTNTLSLADLDIRVHLRNDFNEIEPRLYHKAPTGNEAKVDALLKALSTKTGIPLGFQRFPFVQLASVSSAKQLIALLAELTAA